MSLQTQPTASRDFRVTFLRHLMPKLRRHSLAGENNGKPVKLIWVSAGLRKINNVPNSFMLVWREQQETGQRCEHAPWNLKPECSSSWSEAAGRATCAGVFSADTRSPTSVPPAYTSARCSAGSQAATSWRVRTSGWVAALRGATDEVTEILHVSVVYRIVYFWCWGQHKLICFIFFKELFGRSFYPERKLNISLSSGNMFKVKWKTSNFFPPFSRLPVRSWDRSANEHVE